MGKTVRGILEELLITTAKQRFEKTCFVSDHDINKTLRELEKIVLEARLDKYGTAHECRKAIEKLFEEER